MKNFSKKSILQKTIIAIVVVLLLTNFIVPTYSQAISIGTGVLIDPIIDYFCQTFDIAVILMEMCLTGSGSLMWNNFASQLPGGNEGATYLVPADQYDYSQNTNTNYDAKVQVDADKLEKGWLQIFGTYGIPINTFSAEEIFAGKIPSLGINFISPQSSIVNGKEQSTAYKLREVIATWYVALRNLAIVGLLSVLVYVGIRIIISSTASDKAKYKQMLTDWLIALCLLFFLHYIMSFTITMVESICSALAGQDPKGNIRVEVVNGEGDFTTNLLGLARFRTQSTNLVERGVNLIIYGGLVFMTVVFAWSYIKRVVMMAFLTVIAPLVALTYPIDKMNDGKAQAFNTWLKEYVYNALLQPFHLVLYMVLVGGALDLAVDNPIYAIVAMWFIYTAEKILRKFFGFDKASAGTMNAIGGIAIGSTISKIVGSIGKTAAIAAGKKTGAGNTTESAPTNINTNHGINEVEIPEGQENLDPNLMDEVNEVENKVPKLDIDEQQEMEDLRNYFENTDGNDAYLNANEYQEKLDRLDELENKEKQLENNTSPIEQGDKPEQENKEKQTEDNASPIRQSNKPETDDQNTMLNNNPGEKEKKTIKGWQAVKRRYFTSKNIGVAIERTAIGVGKFAVRFAGGTTGAIIGGIAGGAAGPMGIVTGAVTGANMGSRLGNTALNAGSRAIRGIDEVADTWNGNTEAQKKRLRNEFLSNKDNYNYIRENNKNEDGSYKTYTENMEELKKLVIYAQEGITDIKTMSKARKAADTYGISDKQSAIITAIQQKRGITENQLNDKKQLEALMKNVMHEYTLKNYTKKDAEAQTNYLVNAWKANYGLDNNLNRIIVKGNKDTSNTENKDPDKPIRMKK